MTIEEGKVPYSSSLYYTSIVFHCHQSFCIALHYLRLLWTLFTKSQCFIASDCKTASLLHCNAFHCIRGWSAEWSPIIRRREGGWITRLVAFTKYFRDLLPARAASEHRPIWQRQPPSSNHRSNQSCFLPSCCPFHVELHPVCASSTTADDSWQQLACQPL